MLLFLWLPFDHMNWPGRWKMDVGMWLEPVRLRLVSHCASIRLLI